MLQFALHLLFIASFSPRHILHQTENTDATLPTLIGNILTMWTEYRQLYQDKIPGGRAVERSSSSESNAFWITTMEGRRRGSCVLRIYKIEASQESDPINFDRVWGWNSRYFFEIGRRTSKDRYAVRRLGLHGKTLHQYALEELERDKTVSVEASHPGGRIYRMGKKSWPEVLRSQDTRLQEIKLDQGTEKVTLSCEYIDYYYKSPSGGENPFTIQASAIFNKAKYFLPEKTVLVTPFGQCEVVNVLDDLVGLPVIRRKEETFSWREQPKTDRIEVSYEYEPASSPWSEHDFTLSAFGLPEPYGIEWERPTPWWLYAGIAAGVLVLVIFLLGLWKRRLLARG